MTALARLIQHYLDTHPDVRKNKLADAAGTTPQSLSGWLAGTTWNLDPDNIIGLADAIGVEPIDVIIAISEDNGIPVQRADGSYLPPEIRVAVGALRKLSPERLRAVSRMAADLANDDKG